MVPLKPVDKDFQALVANCQSLRGSVVASFWT